MSNTYIYNDEFNVSVRKIRSHDKASNDSKYVCKARVTWSRTTSFQEIDRPIDPVVRAVVRALQSVLLGLTEAKF